MKTRQLAVAAIHLVALVVACAKVQQTNPSPEATGGIRGTVVGGSGGDMRGTSGTAGTSGGGVGCQRLQCQKVVCPSGGKTTISGTIYDPAGKVPLYNVMVYVPNAPLADIAEGVSCQKCDGTASGSPVASALSDANGAFVMENVPAGPDIPLVIQVGKWRRQVTIPNVAACADTRLTDVNMTRLPRNKSEGSIPKIAVTTGSSDAFECLLKKIGIDDSEFTVDTGTGRINLYAGGDPGIAPGGNGPGAIQFNSTLGGGKFPWATTLWGNAQKMLGYDILVLSCEGGQFGEVKVPYLANVKAYADAGGRLFVDHLHSYFLRKGPAPWPTTAMYLDPNTDPPNPYTSTINTSFPKGAALADWMVNRGASTIRGQILVYEPQHSAIGVNSATTRDWISIDKNTNDPIVPQRPGIQYLTFNTPVEAQVDAQCGRVVFTDIHLNAAPAAAGENKDVSEPTYFFPDGCRGKTLSAQEKALEFMFFDLSSCIMPDKDIPQPPVIF